MPRSRVDCPDDLRRAPFEARKKRRLAAERDAWILLGLVAVPVAYVTYRLIVLEGERGMNVTYAMNIVVVPPLFALLYCHEPLATWIGRRRERKALERANGANESRDG